jgi:AraC-like DNA-binding protein
MSGQLHHNILYSCVDQQRRGNEQFVEEHAVGCMIAGESHFYTNSGLQIYGAGTIGFVKRNQLIKTIKVPPSGGPFMSVNILLGQDVLRRYSAENNIVASGIHTEEAMLPVSDSPFLKGYFDSLLPYFKYPEQLTKSLAELKTREVIELLLRFDYRLKDILFDFNDPYKIDLEAFMNQNYRYNVSASHFARLTGRSLASFKRDFQKTFSTSPQKWLHQKRLEEAHFLIAEKGQKPSDVYLEVGFENLSHFSYSFKQQFGYNPSSV